LSRLQPKHDRRKFLNSMRFRDKLIRIMDRKDHWAWPHFSGPSATRDQLLIHYQQEYITYVRDFPRFLGRLHGQCPDPGARRLLAENLYEEETGGISRTGPHPELFLEMMAGLGFSRSKFGLPTFLPAARTYRKWLDRATTRLPWVVGSAVITIFVEGSVNDRAALENGNSPLEPPPFQPEEDMLVKHHAVPVDAMTLKQAHAQVENGHRLAAWEVVLTHATTPALRRAVFEALEKSLQLWQNYRDQVASKAGVVPNPTVH
jgi:pyrroloquinoline quinone (PQQ) biosynthesis protein C